MANTTKALDRAWVRVKLVCRTQKDVSNLSTCNKIATYANAALPYAHRTVSYGVLGRDFWGTL